MKLFVSDIDGTLLWYDNKNNNCCSLAAKEAINKWMMAGNKFALATARTYLKRQVAMDYIGFDVDYLGGNGAENVYADGHKEFHFLPVVYFLEVGRWIDENGYDATVKICFNDHFISYRNDKYPFNFLERMRLNLKTSTLYTNFEIDENSQGLNMSVLCREDLTKEIETKLKEKFAGRCQVVATDIDNIDFISLEASKAKAILDLAEYYGVKREDIITIGDEKNDISMFEITENSYCMNHSKPDVKEKANYIVDLIEEAIYQQLEKADNVL